MTSTVSSLEQYHSDLDVTRAETSVERVGEEVRADCTLWFTSVLNRPAAQTWEYAKDLNAWHIDLSYNCVIGDQPEGTSVYFTVAEPYYDQYEQNYGIDVKNWRKDLTVKFVDPERLLVLEELSAPTNVLDQWVGRDSVKGREIAAYYILALNEHDGQTTVMARFTYAPTWAPKENEDQLRASFEAMGAEVTARWKTQYFPMLRQLVEAA